MPGKTGYRWSAGLSLVGVAVALLAHFPVFAWFGTSSDREFLIWMLYPSSCVVLGWVGGRIGVVFERIVASSDEGQ